MAEPGAEPTLRFYLHVIRRGWWLMVVGAMVGLGLSLAVSMTATKQYSATAQLLVQSTGAVNLTTGGGQGLITPTDVQTELQLVTSAPVQDEVRAQLGSVPSVAASQVGQTDVIAVTAVSPSPQRAAQIANAYATAFVTWSAATSISNLTAVENQLTAQINVIGREITKLHSNTSPQAVALANQQAVLKGQLAQLEVAGATASTGLELVTPAVAPTAPSSPKPAQNAVLGLLAGLILGVGGAFLRDSMDDSLSSSEAVERVIGVPVFATVPMVASWRKKTSPAAVAVSDPTSQPAEAYRSLRTSLQFASADRPLRTILITSPGAGDGKTATVVNLGTVFAQAGARVVIISCDMRRPGLSQFFAPDDAELSSVLTGKQPLERAVIPVDGVENLWTLGTKAIVANPTELLGGYRMRTVIAELSQRFDIVLLDSPPVLPVADAIILSGYADAVVLVVAAGQTRRAELRRTAEKLAQANAPVVGAVLNKAAAQNGYGYYGGYQPYVLPAGAVAERGQPEQDRREKQNGSPLPSGQPGMHGH